MWADYLTGQELYASGVLKSPRRKAWNFVGATAVYNTSTGMWDITVGGGGGGGHTIEDEGTPLTARPSLNFVGVNVSVADSGGKTVVTIGAIGLAGSGVTGILPASKGGTGLSASGTIGNVLTSDGAGGWVSAAPSGGVTDHGALTGLGDDDHTQYALVDGSRAFTGGVTVTQAAVAGGTPLAFRVTGGAHTNSVASAEIVDVDFGLNRTVQWATGAIASQRSVRFRAPTYAFVGASVITDAATVAITGAPAAGANATITNSYALWVQAGSVRIQALGAGLVKSSATGVLSSATAVTADIGDDQVTYTKIQNVSAASRVLLRGSAAGAGDVQEGSCTGGISISGTDLTIADGALPVDKLTNPTNCAVLVRVPNTTGAYATLLFPTNRRFLARKGDAMVSTQIELDQDDVTGVLPPAKGGNATGIAGTNLTNADQTITIAGGTDYQMLAATTTTARVKTIGITGSPETGEHIRLFIYAQGHNVTVQNGGALASSYVVTAGAKWLVDCENIGTPGSPEWLILPVLRLP
jgi:hypothetical protein